MAKDIISAIDNVNTINFTDVGTFNETGELISIGVQEYDHKYFLNTMAMVKYYNGHKCSM